MKNTFTLLYILLLTFFTHGQTINLTTSPQYIQLGDFDISGSQITIEALIKKNANGGNVLSKHTDPSNVNYLMRIGTFEITTTSGFTLMTNPYAAAMQNGVWYHVAGTYDGSFVRYYVNGCLIVQEAQTGNMAQNNLITAIGNISSLANPEQFYGEIDELRIWNVARTAAQLSANMFTLPNPTTTTGLLAYYDFNGNVTNIQGNATRNGTWVGTPSYGTQPTSNLIQSFTLNSIQVTDLTCFNSADGQITVNASGQALQYSLDNTTWQSSNNFTGLAANTYTVYVRNQEGCVITDATIVVVEPAQIIATATNTGPFCNGAPILLNGTSTATGTVTYAWTGPNGFTSTVQNPTDATAAGTYNLVATSGGCVSPAASTTVVINPISTATATNTGPYCTGDLITLNASTTSTGTATYAWTGPNGFTSTAQNPANATEAGVYSVIITINNCPSQPATTTVVIQTLPTATASNTGPYCTGTPIVLNGASNATGTVTYAWTGPNGFTSTAQNPTTATLAGAYQLIVSEGNCQSASASTTVTINAPSVLTMTKTDVLCNAGSTGTATVSVNTSGNNTYSWSPSGGSNATASNLTPGTYTVTVVNANQCQSSNSITVNQPQALTVTTSVTPSSCINATGTATTTVTGGVAPYYYNWTPGNQITNNATFLAAGTYTVHVMDANACTQQATATIVVANPPVLSVQSNQSPTCFGVNNGSINLATSSGTPAYSYVWSPNVSTSSSATGLSAGTYSVVITDIMGCKDSISYTLVPPTVLAIDFDEIQPNCGSTNGTIQAQPTGGTAPYSYNWISHSLTTNPINNLAAGTYILQLTDNNGCTLNDTIELTPDNNLVVQTNPSTTTINEGTSVNLNVTFTPYIAGSTYSWVPSNTLSCSNCPNPTASPITNTPYTVTIVTPDSCIATATILVNIKINCGEVMVPNVFSPNGDGQNDTFDIHGRCVVSRTMNIFNRWGEKIFSSDTMNLAWDGRYEGKEINSDAYTYVFEVTFLDGSTEKMSGNVNLIK